MNNTNEINDPLSKYPIGLEFPFRWGCDQSTEIWSGNATLRKDNLASAGAAKVSFDFLPRPTWRFHFELSQKRSQQDQMSKVFSGCATGEAILETYEFLGSLPVTISSSVVDSGSSSVSDSGLVNCVDPGDIPEIRSALFGVINGPETQGRAISRGRTAMVGRLSTSVPGLKVTLDSLSTSSPDSRTCFSPTHVARLDFDHLVSAAEIEKAKLTLFWTLSMMRQGWVGLVGPWCYADNDKLLSVQTGITKTARLPLGQTWCHHKIEDAFENLFASVSKQLADTTRSEPLVSAMHWLIESEQCAGAVEGSIILQQAAFECLAWLEIVQTRKLCSPDGFKNLPAADKIRWLLSLKNISAEIPVKSQDVMRYAREFNLRCLTDVMVEVRNALIHAEPKKTAKLFSRQSGSDERTQLWHQIGGILQQAVLASLGYDSLMMRRDVDEKYAANAVVDVPWRIKPLNPTIA